MDKYKTNHLNLNQLEQRVWITNGITKEDNGQNSRNHHTETQRVT
eukprot:UN03984